MGVMAKMIDGLASALGGGMVRGLLDWRVGVGFVGWFAIWHIHRCAGGFPGRSLVRRLGGGTRRLQLLATTVTSLLLLAARIWNGLLLQVWRWWTNGICRMTLGALMLFDVVATLGGGACSTL
jgi:hypothetical protein